MALPKLQTEERYSYADYLTWPNGERWELIDGIPYAMSPAPGTRHQDISREFCRQISNYLLDKHCKVYNAPFDVRFSEQQDAADNYIETVVQPDILVVCDKTRLDERGLNGAPDLIIEILSPSTAAHDIKTKFALYQRHGVKEYWVVHPNDQTVLVFKLVAGNIYDRPEMYTATDSVPVTLLGDLMIDLKQVFAE